MVSAGPRVNNSFFGDGGRGREKDAPQGAKKAKTENRKVHAQGAQDARSESILAFCAPWVRVGLGRGFLGVGRDDPELDFGLDVLAEVELDGVQAEFLERALDADVRLLNR